jgi:spore germination protein YaaH
MKIKFILLFITSIAVITFMVLPPTIPLSPLSTHQGTNPTRSEDYVILGFVPYWNLKKVTPQAGDAITHFAYFALHLGKDGSIYTHVSRREQEPGYTNYERLLEKTVEIPHKPLVLTFMPIDQDALTGILASSTTRTQAVVSIMTSLEESGATGVNIDFEPLGDTPPTLRENFTRFIEELHTKVGNKYELSISMYASSAARTRLWDLAALAPLTDYFVVMTYDYTMPITDKAGPNAPLRGSGQLFEHDIIKNIAEITQIIEPRKILLGIPLYGYEWDTLDSAKYSPTEGRGSVASLERIDQMIRDKTLELVWDRNTLTPYGIASVSGQISQIYFENETSIKLKLDFVKSAGLGGIAIWALGYENNVSWLWPTINTLRDQ